MVMSCPVVRVVPHCDRAALKTGGVVMEGRESHLLGLGFQRRSLRLALLAKTDWAGVIRN